MTLEELHQTLVDGLRNIDQRFVANDQRLDALGQRVNGVDKRLGDIDRRFDELELRINEEADTTRRHFDVMVEKVEAAVRIVAEGHGHLETIVDNHEVRLQTIEKRS
jgi:hypothetical protein